MKKLFSALLCLALLFCITSCGNLNSSKMPTQTGNFTFKISDEVIARIKNAVGHSRTVEASRSAAAPDINIEIHLDKTSGGQLVDPVTVSGSLEELNGRVIEIKNVPLNTPFIVSMVIKVDNKEILTGTSDTITLTSTAPTAVTISLKLSDSLSSSEKDEAALWGTWAFDHGYNQELWADDLITFNIDGTFDSHLVAPYYSEWDTGTWSLSTDAQGRQVLALHITRYSNDNNTWNDVDITSYYYIDVLDDELVMNRFQRDRVEEDGWHPVEYYEPAIYNHYYRVKNGTKDRLIQDSWTVDKLRTQGCDWDETWTFNADGTMTSDWSDNGTEILTGTYDLKEKDGKTILHQQLSFNDGTTGEWWYEYSSCGPDLIRVALINSSSGGELDEPYVNYYYRDVPLVKYTYHWKVSDDTTYTFYDYWPKGKEYTTFDSSKVNYIADVPNQYLEQQILGIYTSEAMTGDPVKKISAAANTADREFWVQWGLKAHHNGTETEFCHSTSIPASDVFPTLTFSEDDTIAIHFEADLSKDINGWTQIKIWPEEWGDPIAFSEVEVHTTGRHLSETYLLKTTAASGQNMSFEYVYNQETGPVVFSNYTLTVLDDTNSYKINYHIGNRTYTERVPVEEVSKELSLETEYYIQNIIPKGRSDFTFNCSEMVDWYTDATLSTLVSSIGPQDKGSTQDVYLEFNPKITRWDDPDSTDGWHNYSATLPAQVLGLDDFAPEAGEPVYLYVEATLSEDLHGSTCIELADGAHDFWWICSSEEKCVYTQNGKLAELYTIHISDDEYYFKEHLKNHPDESDLCIDFVYNQDALDEVVGITNYKVTLVSSSQLYTINYHIGNTTYTEKALSGVVKNLPTTMSIFGDFLQKPDFNLDWNLTFGGYTDNDVSLPASIAAGSLKDVYLKILPKMHYGDAFFYSHLLGNVVLSESDINDLAGSTDPVTFRLTAKTEQTLSGQGSTGATLTITNYEHEEWDIQASANGTDFTKNEDGSWSLTFNLAFADNVTQIQSDPDNILVSFDYNSEFYDGEITFTDFKLELVTN